MSAKLTVLIADDHPIFRKGLSETIMSDPALRLVGQARNGEEAVRLTEESQPDVVILDINMPKLSGLQVARLLKQRRSPCKAVLLTMHEDAALFDEAMEVGVEGYVLKESAVEDLLSAVHRVHQGRGFVSSSLTGLLLKRGESRATLRREKPGLEMLTPTERKIIKLIADDSTTKQIASDLRISPRTVETHRQNISSKLHLSGSHSLLKFAFDNKSSL